MEKLKKLTEIRNWVGKTFLHLIGGLMVVMAIYADAMEMLLISETPAPEWTKKHYILLIIGPAFLIGGVYLNNILDGMSTGFKNFVNKFSK